MATPVGDYLEALQDAQDARKAQYEARKAELLAESGIGDVITTHRVMSQDEFDALVPNENTVYFITE